MNIYNAATQQKFHNLGTIGYVFGALFIILAIAILALWPKAKKNAQKYKENQMMEYKNKNPKSTNDYSKTGMYLPAWERTKYFAPILLCLVFLLIGLAFLIGTPLIKTFNV